MTFNISSHKKTFADVRVDEKVYIIDPKDGSIRETTVTKSFQHPKSSNHYVWVIEIYMPFRLKSIKDEALKEAKQFGTPVTQQFYVPKKESLVFLAAEIPTVLSTEHKYLEEWLKKEKSRLILPRRSV